MKKIAIGLCAVLVACVTPMAETDKPLDYQALKPYRLDAAETVIVGDEAAGEATQKLAALYGQTPEAAVREWVKNRLLTVGGKGVLNVVINQARFTVKKLPMQEGFGDVFSRDQAEQWDAHLSVNMVIEGSAAEYARAEFNISVHIRKTIMEDSGEAAKKLIYNAMINSLMAQFNQEAQEQLQNYFSAYML